MHHIVHHMSRFQLFYLFLGGCGQQQSGPFFVLEVHRATGWLFELLVDLRRRGRL